MLLPDRNPELMNCPFCGSIAIMAESENSSSGVIVPSYRIQCSAEDCAIKTKWFSLIMNAIDGWNKRIKSFPESMDLGDLCPYFLPNATVPHIEEDENKLILEDKVQSDITKPIIKKLFQKLMRGIKDRP